MLQARRLATGAAIGGSGIQRIYIHRIHIQMPCSAMKNGRYMISTVVIAAMIGAISYPAPAQDAPALRPAVTGVKAFSINLSGEAEVPGPGAEGSGTAFVVVNPNAQEICYALDLNGIQPPTAAHIHEGAIDEAGGPVVDFDLANRGFGGCVTDVDADLSQRIADDPANFYVNVHNEEYPQGALRGQLDAEG